MRIIAVVNQKGGVGKTTTCANLGAAMALREHRVLLVDLDPQAHLSISFDAMPAPGEPSLYSLLAGDHELADVVRETYIPNLYMAPTNLDLTGVETELASEIGRETLLQQALRNYSAHPDAPDVVLLDCPPSLGLMSLNALCSAQHVLIPLQAEFFALQGMAQLMDVVDRVKRRLNPSLEILGLLVGMFSKTRNLSREVLQELHEHFGDLLIPTLVRVNVRLAEAPSHAQTIFHYAPASGAAQDFAKVAEELERRLGLPNKTSAIAGESDSEPKTDESPAEASPPAPERSADAAGDAMPASEERGRMSSEHTDEALRTIEPGPVTNGHVIVRQEEDAGQSLP